MQGIVVHLSILNRDVFPTLYMKGIKALKVEKMEKHNGGWEGVNDYNFKLWPKNHMTF